MTDHTEQITLIAALHTEARALRARAKHPTMRKALNDEIYDLDKVEEKVTNPAANTSPAIMESVNSAIGQIRLRLDELKTALDTHGDDVEARSPKD